MERRKRKKEEKEREREAKSYILTRRRMERRDKWQERRYFTDKIRDIGKKKGIERSEQELKKQAIQ